ncbi:unnamed protein product [Debaryomyces tyrocola]|nr:unnamed protein product [Debaryomyces tyrocola]
MNSHGLCRRLIIIICVLFMCAIGLGVGLGVGISQNKRTVEKSEPDSNDPPVVNYKKASLWKPKKGLTWQYQLASPFKTLVSGVDVYDIDLFENSEETISNLQKQGKKVICYFSAGSYENWRPDKEKFAEGDLGKSLDGWKGERWLNVKSQNVRKIMKARLDLAVQKKCDGVEPDNVDGYDNDNGIKLTEKDAIDYMNFLASEAHHRNLSIGLKNAGSIVKDLVNLVEWAVQEQCIQFGGCREYQSFIKADKPVFHVEYPKGEDVNNNRNITSSKFNKICNNVESDGFSTIVKNMNLDYWIEVCPIS